MAEKKAAWVKAKQEADSQKPLLSALYNDIVLPIECKAGTSGKMKSLHLFMHNKHLTNAVRCSLENFSLIETNDNKDGNAPRRIHIIPLFAISNLFLAQS